MSLSFSGVAPEEGYTCLTEILDIKFIISIIIIIVIVIVIVIIIIIIIIIIITQTH